VKVMDFGIARAVAESGATMTQTAGGHRDGGLPLPEQARGEHVDARSDRLLHRLPALRAGHRGAAVHRRQRGRGRLPARARGPDPAVGLRRVAGPARRRRRPHGHGQEPGGALPERRRAARRLPARRGRGRRRCPAGGGRRRRDAGAGRGRRPAAGPGRGRRGVVYALFGLLLLAVALGVACWSGGCSGRAATSSPRRTWWA
jgi:hypothetical protein